MKDEGLYSISASNIAGSISTSVYVHIDESDYNDYDTTVDGKKRNVSSRSKKFKDLYDLGDELGRGTQGVVYHAVERDTGEFGKIRSDCIHLMTKYTHVPRIFDFFRKEFCC